ncbi:MAG: DUF4838 domain-containing protein [Lentisphaeria bacterium]|nr:DUF4838 domain-containing protein [Lentisphaeria bacterium]
MKRFGILLLCLSAVALFAARPVAVGGYRYEARRIMAEVVNKNCWIGKSETPATADYKKYSAIFLGEQLKKAPENVLWNTPAARKDVMDYLNGGGIIVTSGDMPRSLLSKKNRKETVKIFGFVEVTACKEKIAGAKVGNGKELYDWQLGGRNVALHVAKDAEVLAYFVLENGKSFPAVVKKKIGKGEIWWISVPLNRLKEYYHKNKVNLGVPDDEGRFIATRAGEAVEALEKIYNLSVKNASDIEVNQKAKAWGSKPLGTPGNLKLNDKFEHKPVLRSGFPEYNPGLVLCDSKSQAVIYYSGNETKNLAYEIKYHLDKMSGKKFVVTNTYPDASVKAVILGGPETAAAKFGLKSAHPDRDTILITRKGNHLFVGGVSLGISQAVTVFLESLGCRYLWPGVSGKVIPRKQVIVAPELNINHTAKLFMVRSVRSNGFRDRWAGSIKKFGFSSEEMEKIWYKYSRDGKYNREYLQWHGLNEDPRRFGYEKKANQIYEWGHAFNHFYNVHGKKYPECFALQPDGSRKQPARPRLCHSNEQLIKLIVAEKVANFKANPHKKALSLCLNDGGQSSMCLCENCRKLDPVNAHKGSTLLFAPVRKRIDYVSFADRVLTFSNRIAEEVLKQVPGKQFTFYAYAEYEKPPVKVKPHPSLILFSVAGRYTNEARRQTALKTVASWSHFGNPILWRPNALSGFRDVVIPQNYARKMFNDIELFKANNIIGDDVDDFEMQWACKTMVYYAFGKAQWNYAGVDYDTIFNDFCEKGFNAAAPAVKEYFNLLEKLFDNAADSGTHYIELVTEKDLDALARLLDKARNLAKGDDEVITRINFLEKGLNVGKVCRKLHFAKKNSSPEFTALRKEFIRIIREYALTDPAAVNPEKIGFYSPYLR